MRDRVAIDFDPSRALAVRLALIGKAQAALDIQVIKDSNFFCPHDQGTLQASALTASNIGQGSLMWATPYARRQYYEAPNKSHDMNPNARMKWFEEAKAIHLADWLGVAEAVAHG